MRHSHPTPTSPEGAALREEFKTAAIAAARVKGWKRLDRAALVARFEGHASRASLYRWLKGIEGAPLKRTVPEMVQDAQSGDAATALSVAREIKKAIAPEAAPEPCALPVPTLEEAAAAVVPLPVMALLQECIRAGQDVIAKSRGPDGDVRNARLVLRAAENLRRSVETAARLQALIMDQLQVDRFHEVVMEEVSIADPEVGRRIVARLQDLNATWTARLETEQKL